MPLVALGSIYLVPAIWRSVNATHSPATLNHPHPRLIWPAILASVLPTIAISSLIFGRTPSWADCIVAALLYVAIVRGRPREGPTHTSVTRLVRTYLKIIMENDDSRKIFYFLMVNLGYMVIQLLWGFWTNSLGLVSDGASQCNTFIRRAFLMHHITPIAIHMLFDCFSVGGERGPAP